MNGSSAVTQSIRCAIMSMKTPAMTDRRKNPCLFMEPDMECLHQQIEPWTKRKNRRTVSARPFSDKAAMEKYLAGRIKAHDRLFTETMPPVRKGYAEPFKVNGLLLPGYAIEGEPPQHHRAPTGSAADALTRKRWRWMPPRCRQHPHCRPPQPQPVIPINLTARSQPKSSKKLPTVWSKALRSCSTANAKGSICASCRKFHEITASTTPS